MAHYKQLPSGNWHAQVERCGVREGKTFPSREAAEEWAAGTESRIKRHAALRTAGALATWRDVLPPRVAEALAAVPHTAREIAACGIPVQGAAGVYFLIRGDAVVYVGKSSNVFRRLGRHIDDGDYGFDSFSWVCCPPEDQDRLESLYIAALVPLLNTSLGAATSRRP